MRRQCPAALRGEAVFSLTLLRSPIWVGDAGGELDALAPTLRLGTSEAEGPQPLAARISLLRFPGPGVNVH